MKPLLNKIERGWIVVVKKPDNIFEQPWWVTDMNGTEGKEMLVTGISRMHEWISCVNDSKPGCFAYNLKWVVSARKPTLFDIAKNDWLRGLL